MVVAIESHSGRDIAFALHRDSGSGSQSRLMFIAALKNREKSSI